MGNLTPKMPEALVEYLKPGAPALLLTAGSDGYPSSAYTWAISLSPICVRFAVDTDGTAMVNLADSGLAGLHIIGPDNLAFLVKGKSRRVKDSLAAISPNKMMVYEMDVIGARDQSFPGVTAKPFTYEWPEDQKDTMAEMEKAVFLEMKG